MSIRPFGERPVTASERAQLLDVLARAEGGKGAGERSAVGEGEAGVELEQRSEDEAAAGHLGMGQGEAVGRELLIAEQQQVDVERSGTVAGGVEGATALHLDLLADLQQGLRLQLGADADRRVEEVGLIEQLADRLGLIGGGDGLDLNPALAQQLDRRPQVGGAVADVGAEPQVSGPHASPPFSSSSSSSWRSWVTSTPTSWIASGSGGSDLEARTRTDSQP